MKDRPKLFMVMLGCTPEGRYTEQHDIFFGIGHTVYDLKKEMIDFWPEAKGKIHMDAWREVNIVNGYRVEVVDADMPGPVSTLRLFFLNLGGYKAGVFDELHYKLLVAATDMAEAVRQAKETAFYMHSGFKGAASHIDDKYGVDVDDIYEIPGMLPLHHKAHYRLILSPVVAADEDRISLGYMKLY